MRKVTKEAKQDIGITRLMLTITTDKHG